MSTSIPQIPPRPARAQDSSKGSTLGSEIPKIPPRPANRRLDRSVSPARESFARSPLNEMTFPSNQGAQSRSSLYLSGSANNSSTELPPRPSSVVLPSLGQEGSEYAEAFSGEELGSSPTQTRNVANDLKLHAPKPSLPTSSAKQRVSTVTRTDSGQAAAFGIGKATNDDKEPSSRSLKERQSFSSQNSNHTERPPSSLEGEHGIPEIGQQVPMYPNAGDVQAPSPSPYSAPFAPGIGFHNDGSKPRHHGRKTSGRGVDIPFDAYGKHGHGQVPHDRFEKAYYEKHPELLKKETGHYHGPFAEGRAEWAMSSDDLNKIVRDTASRGSGLGTNHELMSTPSEQIGFQATEEYASRISSPRPQSGFQISHPNSSQTHVDSPLRKESFPADTANKAEFEGTLSRSLHAPSDTALESEVEDEDTIHVEAPRHRISKIYGSGYADSVESLGQHAGHGGEGEEAHDEHGYSAPILASDEVAKEPFGWELQPAVSPLNERRASFYEEGNYHARSGSASSLNGGSRSSSRPGSIHGTIPGFRISDSTPLEDLNEYEPLFPEDEHSGQAAAPKNPLTAADKLKRPELKNRKFPSQDIWEDTPNSLQYTATVSTPQLPEETEGESKPSRAQDNETPGQAFARRQEELAEAESKDSGSFLSREKKPWAHQSQLLAETRPGSKQRFPSRDIWEDTPDSLQLETTVAGPQSDEKELTSPQTERSPTEPVSKPFVPARPARSKPSESPEKSQSSIPVRTSQRSQQDEAISPTIAMKSKPAIPARPSKPLKRDSSEGAPLSTVASNSSARSLSSDLGGAAASKPKPPVPTRPVGSKIAALQSGFMSDLNKRLQLGPQAPKKEEVSPEEPQTEKEKAPLVDARKGRARGPARRAPAKSPAPASQESAGNPAIFTISQPSTLWQIDPEEDSLYVSSAKENVVPEKQSAIPEPIADITSKPEESPVITEISSEHEKAEEVAKEEPSHSTAVEDAPASSHVESTEEEDMYGSTATLKADAGDSVE